MILLSLWWVVFSKFLQSFSKLYIIYPSTLNKEIILKEKKKDVQDKIQEKTLKKITRRRRKDFKEYLGKTSDVYLGILADILGILLCVLFSFPSEED